MEKLSTTFIGNLFVIALMGLAILSYNEFGLIGFWIYPIASMLGAFICVAIQVAFRWIDL